MIEMQDRCIIEANIPDWNCCFNCVFSFYDRRKFKCILKREQIYKKHRTNKIEYTKNDWVVKNTDNCEYIIKRPDGSAELYGFQKAILYTPRETGIKAIEWKLREKHYYPRISEIQKKLGLSLVNIIKTIEFRWTFGSSKDYALIRNQFIYKTPEDKYHCALCNKLFRYYEIQVHHIRERTENGSDSTANLKILCLYCHDLETWKLMTNNKTIKEIPIEIIWKKLIMRKYKLWREMRSGELSIVKWKKSQIQFRNEQITNPKIFRPDLTEEKIQTFIQELKDDISILEKEIKLKLDKNTRAKRKYAFWRKYNNKTKKWKTTLKKTLQSDLAKKHITLDKFYITKKE